MRKYGQHFLVSDKVIAQIVAAVPDGFLDVAEIGPGRGALTEKLLQKDFKNFTLFEIDPEMQQYLTAHFPELSGHIVLGDFVKFDLDGLPPRPTFFVSNLPYIDAAAILDKVLSWPYFAGAVFMFQKEQAQRILAREGQEGYGPLSILSQLRSVPKQLLRVGKACFNPPPKVDSMVLTFARKEGPFNAQTYERFARLIKAAFLHRRKTLFNALALCGYEKTKAAASLAALGLSPTVRAEEVSIFQFVQLFKQLAG